MTRTSRTAVLFSALAGAVALAGASAAAPAAKVPAGCSLLQPAQILAALHVKVGACAEGDLGPQRGATWRTPNGEEAVVQVSLTGQNAAQQYSAFTALAKGVKVAGVGDKAFYDTAQARFYFLKHNVYVEMSLLPKTGLAAATKLAKIAAGRLK